MRSILVHADRTEAGQARVETALSLARMTRGHVTLLVDTPLTLYSTYDGIGGVYVVAEGLREAMARDDTYASTTAARLAHEDVPYDVLRSEAEPEEALAGAARLADLVVVSRGDQVAGSLPVLVRSPVLAMNDDQPLVFPLEHACIAWDGSPAASASLRASVPLLAGCGDVTVLTIEKEPESLPEFGAVEYLSRHGIHAEQVTLPRKGSIEATLSREFKLRKCQLLVMGAFGHSRISEFLFGGVTRSMLDRHHAPALLLAH